MLGSLATWLRILGVDTVYPSNTVSDNEILQQARQEDRMILTRDKVLASRARKEKIPVLQVTSTDLNSQLEQTVKALSIDSTQILTRCTLCNSSLVPVPGDQARPHVPLRVLERQTKFCFCRTCQKYYWMGTHYEAMEKKIKSLLG